ncbi:MAG TPA: rod shape-determining protein MreC [Candidatus Sulfomarinibacteraceae bacterium]|nr:rod shape-determining protein MreC [Candidatus Sulfomarinibacteraceae bacterium]
MNLNDTQQRVRSTTIIVLVVMSLAFLILDSTGNLDNAFSFLRSPVATVMGWTAGRVDNFASVFAGPRDVQLAQQQITELETRVAQLERENAELRNRQQDYEFYVQLFDRATEAPQFERVTASIIGRDTSPVFKSIIIDKGTNDGVQPGMPVESPRGLVGQVFRASPGAAQVLLMTDNVSSIAARLSESRATGMVFGGGTGGVLMMDWIDQEARVQVGDTVVTSGLGSKFPQDLIIGTVVEVERNEADLFQRAIIQPAVNFDRLEMVFVLSNFEPVDISVFDEPPDVLPEP